MRVHELTALLGDDLGLDGQQVKDLLDIASTIEARYPDPADAEERGAALVAAYRLMAEADLDGLVREYGDRLRALRRAQSETVAALRQLAGCGMSEAEFARAAGVDRMTVRSWLGKR